MTAPKDLVLFDPVETLGAEIAASRTQRFAGFSVYPSAQAILDQLRDRARLGVFSLDPDVPVDRLRESLGAARLVPPIEPERIGVAARNDRNPFGRILGDEFSPEQVVFVSVDAGQRARALEAGLRVSPHPALVADVLDGEVLRLGRFPGRLADLALLAERVTAVPVLSTADPDFVYAIVGESRLQVANAAVGVEAIGPPDFVGSSTLVLLQLPPEQVRADPELSAFIEGLLASGLPLVEPVASGWIVALPSDRSPDVLHPPPAGAGHGHTRILQPSLTTLARRPAPRRAVPRRPLSEEERALLEEFDGRAIVDRMRAWSSSVGPERGDERPRP